MPIQLSPDLVALINDPRTTKLLATVDSEGTPHVVFKDSLHVPAETGDATNEIHLLEFLESSTTGKNLVRSIWFDRPLSIALRGADGREIQIKGRAVRLHHSGPLFQQHYTRLLERDIDLAGVWVIAPESVSDQHPEHRRAEEAAAHPGFIHLDRILKTGDQPHETH